MRRVFNFLLNMFPREFREQFGEPMRVDLEDGWKGRRSFAGRLRFLLAAVLEMASAAASERFRELRLGDRGYPASRWRPGDQASRWDGLAHDARHAFHRMIRNPVSSAATIVILGLGLGVATAVFSMVDGVLLEPLPYTEPDRLVRVWTAEPEGSQRYLQATWSEVHRFAELSAFNSITAYSVAPRDLFDDSGWPTGIEIARVSSGFLETIGVQPIMGRGFTADESSHGSAALLLAHRFWQSRYGGDETILGKTVSIQGVEHAIVGVLPSTFDLPHGVAFWRPFTSEEKRDEDRELAVLARLSEGSSLQAAEAELRAVGRNGSGSLSAWLQPIRDSLVRNVKQPLWMLLAAVAGLLLLTCSNVAHLQLARIAWRKKEIAVRSALGAEAHRLFRLLLLESLAFAAFAGLLGLFLGQVLVSVFRSLAPADFPRLAEVGLDARVVFIATLSTLVSGFLAAWLPARQGANSNPARDLVVRDSGNSSQTTSRGILVTAQVALATLLTISAGLLFTSIGKQLDLDHGVDLESVVRLHLSPPASADEPDDRPVFYRRMMAAIAEVPGVGAVGIGNHDALSERGFQMPFELPGGPSVRVPSEAEVERRVTTRIVDRGWVRAAGLRFLAGGNFQPSTDRPAAQGPSEGSVIVDRAFLRSEMGLSDPSKALGRWVRHARYVEGFPSTHRIIGVVESVRSLAAEAIVPKIYLPYSEFQWPRMHLLVRLEEGGSVEALIPRIRAKIWALEPTIPIGAPETFAAAVAKRLEHRRFQLRLMASFSHLALFLATVGIYAMLLFQIERRLPEIGLRRALGASWLDIARRVLVQALRLVIPGLILGLVGAFFVGKVLANQLYGVAAVEVAVWSLVAASILFVTALATVVPMRKAISTQPTRLLQRS